MRTPARDSSGTMPSIEQVRQMFLEACAAGQMPDPESFVETFSDPERSGLRDELERLREQHSHLSRQNGSAAEAGTRSERTAETRKPAPPSPTDTGEFTPVSGDTVDLPGNGTGNRAQDQGTSEFRHLSPDATLDHAPMPGRTGEYLVNPNATGEFVSLPDATIDHDTARVSGLSSGLDSGSGETLDHDTAPIGTGEYVSLPEASRADAAVAKKKAVPLPTSVAGYEVLDVLGRGAMGVVYKARQRGLKRLVALKMILSGEHAGEQELARFRAEANAVAQLQHPGIIQIYEVGEDDGRPFFSLEFVDGTSLHKKLQGNPLPPKEAASLLKQMADAMAYAHSRGVIHRDLKPANVLLTSDGIPKIGDFGLAKRLEDDESGITKSGTVMGTPSYMPPEQAAGLIEQVGPLADVYSLGAMLYDMLTGRPPFRGTSVMDTIQQLQTREPVPPVHLQPSVPKDLETICLKCLEKDRQKRYAGAGELAADVQRFLNGEPILARPISAVERAWRWSKRNKFKAVTYAAAVAVVLFLFFGSVGVALVISAKNTELDHTNIALDAKNTEVELKNVALDAKNVEVTNQKNIAEKNEAEAKRQTKVANDQTEHQRRTAEEALLGLNQMAERVYTLIQSKKLSIASPEALKFRNDTIASVRNSLMAIVKRLDQQAVSTYADLFAHQLMADLLLKFGQSKEPKELYTEAIRMADERATREPQNDRTRANLGALERRLGLAFLNADGDARSALPHMVRARVLHKEIQEHPRSKDYTDMAIKLVIAHDDLALGQALIALGRSADTREYLQEAYDYFAAWEDELVQAKKKNGGPRSFQMQASVLLGTLAAQRNDAASVDRHFARAIELSRALNKEFDDHEDYKGDMADALGQYGDALLMQGKRDEAEAKYSEALKYMLLWNALRPDDLSRQDLHALTVERLGTVCRLAGRADESKELFQEAMQLRKELWQVEGSNLYRQIGYVLAMARAGQFADAARLVATIRPRMTKSTELMLQVARCHAVLARDGAADRPKHIADALSALAEAVGNEFKDALALETDPDLTAIRGEPAFKELIAKMKARK